MFEEDNRKGFLPGYTGHIPTKPPTESFPQVSPPKKHIPGYGGFVPSIKSENLFAESFAKTTEKSGNKNISIGQDVNSNIKYTSMANTTFVNQAQVIAPTVAETVGVDKGKPSYKQPVIPENVNKFFGVEYENWNASLKNKVFDNTAKGFFTHKEGVAKADEKQSEEIATMLFYGVQEKHLVKLGEPLPGYQGYNKRIVADNIYGATYQVAKANAKVSHQKIREVEASELRKTGKMNAFKTKN